MRLLNLNLKAIGPFTDVNLDLSRGDHGLHVILGPNEAGKSSSLRAISYLFFGFPTQTADRFLHDYEKLRVGATLRHGDGTEMEILRRKANRDQLRGGDDSTIIKPEQLAHFLGSLDEESFQHRFGIDHGRLRLAGEEIRAGKGHLGEMLFAAGAGLAGLRQVQQTLQNRAGDLFKPRGQNQRINAALSGLRDAQADQKEHQLPSEEWQKHAQALKQAEERAEGLVEQLSKARRERNRLERLGAAIPLVSRRRRLREEREQHGDAPLLRDDFGKEARAAMDSQLLADRIIARARATLDELVSQIGETIPSATVLDASEEIEALQQRLGTVEKAAVDRISLDNFRKDKEHRARQLLQELGQPVDLEQAGALRLRADEPKIIRALGQQYAEPRGQLDLTRAAIARQEALIADSERELAELPLPPDVSNSRKALRSAQKRGDLDTQIDKARAELAKVEKKLSLALAQLSGWDRSAEELLRLAIPSKEALDHFEGRFQKLERSRERLTEALAKSAEAARALEAQVRAIESAGDVPLETDLDAARRRRNLGWRLVRETWLGNSVDQVFLASFLAEGRPGDSLAEAYEASVQRADEIGDRLRRESANVARKAGWLSDIRRHGEEGVSLERELQEVDVERTRLDSEWAGSIDFLGAARVRSVGEIRAWIREREKVVQLIEKVQEAHDLLAPIDSARDSSIESLRLALGNRGSGSASLADCIEQAEAVIQEADVLVKRRERLEATIKTAKAELATARRSHESAQAKLDEWRTEWAPKMERIGLEPGANPLQAEDALVKIQELETVLKDIAGFVSRIKGIDRDEAEFRTAVDSLAARVGFDDAKGSAYDRARKLARLLKENRAIEVNRAGLLEQHRQEDVQLRQAEEERESSRLILARLCREAGCKGPDDLAEFEARSRSRVRIEDEMRVCEEQLFAAAAGADIVTFSAEVEPLDLDELNASHGQLGDESAVLEKQIEEVNRIIGAERAELARMDGLDDRAAQAAEKAQAFLAQLQGDVARFAAIRISSAVLRRAVERYREKSQGPVLDRASGLFADLTGGSFAKLDVDDDGSGRMILKGVRPDGRHVGVEGMSEGSHDQLYLALRLASLETWLDGNEPIPFIVDDILLSFDDRRATAALKALAVLSRRTQVLFFTHHHRLAELAQSELSPDDVFVQELPSPNR